MTPDPNWLYSTIAQSSAAIVAIVGGFVTASLLMLTAEKRNLAHQKADKETRLKALKKEGQRLHTLYRTMEVDHFFESIKDELKKEDELPSFEVLMQSQPLASYLDPVILKQEYGKLTKLRLEAREFMELHSGLISSSESILFGEWVKKNEMDIPLEAYNIYRDEYDRFCNRKRQIEAAEPERAILPWLKSPSLLFGIPSLRETQYDLYWRDKEDRRMEDVERRFNSLRQETLLLKNEIASLGARLEAFSYPPNLGWGIGVLGYLAVFGILFPVFMIWTELYSDIAKKLVVYCFYGGILGLFAYIIVQIRTLRR